MSQERYGSPWLTVKEAASYCRCGVERMASAIACGEVQGYLPPGASERSQRVIVNKLDLDAWVRTRAKSNPLAEALRSRCC